MPDTFQIKCITKRGGHYNPHERIQEVGGFDNGQRWKISEDVAIQGMESGKWKFYSAVGNQSVWVIIAIYNGRKYLKTQTDGYEPNNLLSLPDCP